MLHPKARCGNMPSMRGWQLIFVGCGRLAFDPLGGDGGASDVLGDGPSIDAPPAIPGMVYVAEGLFVMGSDAGEGATDEEPEHVVKLTRGYYIDQHEVTNKQYRDCVGANACTPPASSSSNTRSTYYTMAAFDDYPVIRVTWTQAVTYCTWAGKRLPTEAEWEKAARGGCELTAPVTCGPEDERRWPWGNAQPTCTQANVGDMTSGTYCVPGGDTDRVGARSPAGDSPYGVRDLSGNVWEWVEDFYATSYTWCTSSCVDPSAPNAVERVERGGGFLANDLRVTTTFKANLPVTDEYNDLGFRCARSL